MKSVILGLVLIFSLAVLGCEVDDPTAFPERANQTVLVEEVVEDEHTDGGDAASETTLDDDNEAPLETDESDAEDNADSDTVSEDSAPDAQEESESDEELVVDEELDEELSLDDLDSLDQELEELDW